MIYVYAFCPKPSIPLSLPVGITSAPVQLISVGDLGAIAELDVDVSHIKDDDQQLMTAVLNHDRVLGHLFTQTVLLPLRFGTQFIHQASLQSYLQTHQLTYLQRLDALANKAEYLVKLAPKSVAVPPVDSTVTGRAYFLAKKTRLQAQTQVQLQQTDELHHFLETLHTSHIAYVQSSPQEGEERLHLLLMRDPDRATAQLADWQRQLPSWDLSCSQPLPPYHFAT